MIHHLKIWPQYFQAVKEGRKNFEVRNNDRGFQAGDHVILQEFDPEAVHVSSLNGGKYSGAQLKFEIGYVLPIDADRVVFSLIERVDP